MQPSSNLEFSVYFFGNMEDDPQETYDLIRAVSRKADASNFTALWFPERHFDRFGGFSPNPSLLAGAIACETRRIRLKASVILPLHHPVRVAEEWAMVDHLSDGRVGGLAFVPGWHQQDFVLAPEMWANRYRLFKEHADVIRNLWSGQTVSLRGVEGKESRLKIYPCARQSEIPISYASLGNMESLQNAGRMGAGLLTNLLRQDVEDLQKTIEVYRDARIDAGMDQSGGRVTLLMHTYLHEEKSAAIKGAHPALKRYMKSSLDLISKLSDYDLSTEYLNKMNPEDLDYLVERATDKFISGRSLIGDLFDAVKLMKRFEKMGVTEVACFLDFGLPADLILSGMNKLSQLISEVHAC
jgi:iturin family lipopeptide synthetase A